MLMLKKLSNDEFTQKTEQIVFYYSLAIVTILLIVMAFFGLRYVVSVLIGYAVSALIFFKDNRVIDGLLYKRLLYPRFWMVASNIVSYLFYIGITLLFIYVPYLTLWGITGLFVMEASAIIASIVHR